MTTTFVDLDVRPILKDGGEPFDLIMKAMAALGPDQGLRLLATFQPIPLFHVMKSKGFTHEATEIGEGDWEVLFTPGLAVEAETPTPAPAAAAAEADGGQWPEPEQQLDNRDLEPPEPMVRVLAAIETMQHGQVLSALLCREPMFLFPELEKRGHQWRGGFEPDGTTYKVLIRVLHNSEDAA
ncbi:MULTISPECIES: DUF2249 domain-containing protein [unclassified Hoeflea]|jgi:uncharacterized protein (DUF2249 family)|uniref:DUF2249 domain-containing protein n=1 Tax=unclassified Hoeflea TaxID=2614931 RepID=UPI002AFF194C|nr:DUF2249 domain-containing protein [Hoeflea sp.]